MSSSSFLVSRCDPRGGRPIEVPIAGTDTLTPAPAEVKEQAVEAFHAALPELLNGIDLHIVHLESTMPDPGSIQYNAAVKAAVRFKNRRSVIAPGKFPFDRTLGFDSVWTDRTGRLFALANAAGLIVDGEHFEPSDQPMFHAAPATGLLSSFKKMAAKVRRPGAENRQAASQAAADTTAYMSVHRVA